MKNTYPKIFGLFILLFSFTGLKAQAIHDFQYIIVPEKFTDFNENQYNLNHYLKLKLEQKGYTVLSRERNSWPDELKADPCKALTTDIKQIKDILKIKIQVIFSDCNLNNVSIIDSESKIKDFDRGYTDAVRLASNQVFPSAPRDINISSKTLRENSPEPAVPTIKETLEIVPVAGGIPFSDGNNNYHLQKDPDSENFILYSSDQKAQAILVPTSRKGVFQVTVLEEPGNYETVGFYDGETIEIDFKSSSGETKTKNFNKL